MEEGEDSLLCFSSSSSGDLMIYSVEGKELVLLQHMTNAHSDIVRDVLWFEQVYLSLLSPPPFPLPPPPLTFSPFLIPHKRRRYC